MIINLTLPAGDDYTSTEFVVPFNFKWMYIYGDNLDFKSTMLPVNPQPLIKITNLSQNYFYFKDYIGFYNIFPTKDVPPSGVAVIPAPLPLPKFEILNVNDILKIEMKATADISNRSIQLVLIGVVL
jgi:hypothetical protein